MSTLFVLKPAAKVYAADGKGNALDFDGINDEVSVLPIDAQVYSLELWFEPQAYNTLTGNALIGSYRFLIQVSDTSLTVWHSVYVGPVSWYFSPIGTGNWNHLAVIIDYTNWKITPYLNGSNLGEQDTTTQTKPVPMTNITIGSYMGSRFFDGAIDEVRVYNRTLSASEVSAHYNGGIGQYGRPEAGLAGGWHFDETSGNVAHDYSGNGNDGTVYGALWVDGIVPLPDVEVSSVTTSTSKVVRGNSVTVNVTANNLGTCNESFTLTAYYDSHVIGFQQVTNLGQGSSMNLTFAWDTTGVPLGTYTIKANATIVEGEQNTANNEKIDDAVWIVQHPAPSFDWTPTSAIENYTTTFNATSTNPYGGSIVNYTWNFDDGHTTTVTIPTITHIYALRGDYNVSLTVVDTEDLTNSTWSIVEVRRHDVAIVDVTPSRDWIYETWTMDINVTIANKGDFAENVNVALYYNATGGPALIGTQSVNLGIGETKILTFSWDTTGAEHPQNHTITAVETTSPDSNMTNNELTSPQLVKVRLLGDINGDDNIGIDDIYEMASDFGASKGQPRWNPDADFTTPPDDYIGIDDIFLVASRFGR
jgi:hypothetical protein